MVCPALSECRVGDGLVIGVGMVERFQLVARPYEINT
jgi:hypothetical protein